MRYSYPSAIKRPEFLMSGLYPSLSHKRRAACLIPGIPLL